MKEIIRETLQESIRAKQDFIDNNEQLILEIGRAHV